MPNVGVSRPRNASTSADSTSSSTKSRRTITRSSPETTIWCLPPSARRSRSNVPLEICSGQWEGALLLQFGQRWPQNGCHHGCTHLLSCGVWALDLWDAALTMIRCALCCHCYRMRYCHRHAATAIDMQLLLSTCSYCHRHAKTGCSVLDVLDRTENSEVEDFSLALIIVPQGRCFWGSTLEFPPVDFAVVVGVQPFWKKSSKDL